MREVKSVDPRLAIIGAATVRELIDRDVTQERLVTQLTERSPGWRFCSRPLAYMA